MCIDANTIITAGAVLTAMITILTLLYRVVNWFRKQEEQSVDIESLRKQHEDDMKAMSEKQAADIQELKDEQCLMSYAMLACLDGLKQLHCNGEVTIAHGKLEKHLNQKAHNQKS